MALIELILFYAVYRATSLRNKVRSASANYSSTTSNPLRVKETGSRESRKSSCCFALSATVAKVNRVPETSKTPCCFKNCLSSDPRSSLKPAPLPDEIFVGPFVHFDVLSDV